MLHTYRILYLKTLTAVRHGDAFPLLSLSLFCRRGEVLRGPFASLATQSSTPPGPALSQLFQCRSSTTGRRLFLSFPRFFSRFPLLCSPLRYPQLAQLPVEKSAASVPAQVSEPSVNVISRPLSPVLSLLHEKEREREREEPFLPWTETVPPSGGGALTQPPGQGR